MLLIRMKSWKFDLRPAAMRNSFTNLRTTNDRSPGIERVQVRRRMARFSIIAGLCGPRAQESLAGQKAAGMMPSPPRRYGKKPFRSGYRFDMYPLWSVSAGDAQSESILRAHAATMTPKAAAGIAE